MYIGRSGQNAWLSVCPKSDLSAFVGVTPEGVKSGNFSGWLGKGNWRWHNDPSDEFQAAYLCLLEMGPKDSHIKIFWRSTVKQNAINSPCFQVCDGMDQFCWAI